MSSRTLSKMGVSEVYLGSGLTVLLDSAQQGVVVAVLGLAARQAHRVTSG
jgi:hypothetical protein